MATSLQPTRISRRMQIWQALKDLNFLSAFFSWFFMLLTRLSEPLMLLSTLYVVAETGVPAIALLALHNLAIGIMITAPEVILPGSFVVASQAHGTKHARLLLVMCWLFVLLTLVTLVSLFVLHFTGEALAWLMCARCAAAVGYSILMRVMSHHRHSEQATTPPAPDLQVLTERFTEHLGRIEANTQARITETERGMTERFTELMQAFTERFERTSSEQTTAPALAELTSVVQAHTQALTELAALPGIVERQLRQIQQEMNATRPKLALVDTSPKPGANTDMDKGTFVRQCLTETPNIRNAEIARKASEHGMMISPAYISEIRKAFSSEQQTESERAS